MFLYRLTIGRSKLSRKINTIRLDLREIFANEVQNESLVVKTMGKLLYTESVVRRRYLSTLLLPLCFLVLITVFLELSVRLECDDLGKCVMVRTTVFTQRRTSEFTRQEVSGLECIGSDYGPERASGKCHLGFALRGSPDVLPFFHFEDGSKAIVAADELRALFLPTVSKRAKEQGRYVASFHGSFVGMYAEGMSYLGRLLFLGLTIVLAILAVSIIVPYKREWRISNAGVLAGYDCYLHTETVWRGSFYTLDKYRVSIESKEVNRRGIVYGIYWLSLCIGGSKSVLGEVVRNDADLLEPLHALQNELGKSLDEQNKKKRMKSGWGAVDNDTANYTDNDNGKREKQGAGPIGATLKKRRVD